uniref:Uncharacterized protein n=1 Tax=Peronospora matthiolae TaxID=2874970 RepID=A0AAV1UJJ7_9STRA
MRLRPLVLLSTAVPLTCASNSADLNKANSRNLTSSADFNKTKVNAISSKADLSKTEIDVLTSSADPNERQNNTSSSNADFNKMKVNASTSVRSGVRDINSVLVNGVARVRNTTNGEERALPHVASLVSGRIADMDQSTLKKAMELIHVDHYEHKLTEQGWERLQGLDHYFLEPFAVELKAESSKIVISPPTSEVAGHELIIDQARASKVGKKHLMRAIFTEHNSPMNEIHIVKTQETAQKWLDVAELERIIEGHDWWKRFKKSDFLISLMENSGGAAKFAPIVSIAKKSQIAGQWANELQTAMLEIWLNNNKSIDDVYDLLGLSEKLMNEGYTYENVDTLDRYIAMYNKRYGATEDLDNFLRKKLGDENFALVLQKGVLTSQHAAAHLRSFVKQWIGRGKTAADLVCKFLSMADDSVVLLDPLAIAFGGDARLAPLLSIAKKRAGSQANAKIMQKAMLMGWLNAKKPVDEVFHSLGMFQTREFKYENMDTLEQYVALLNKENNADIDMFTYLRTKFGDGNLAMMILKQTKLLPGVTKPFVKKRIGEGKSSVDVLKYILAMTYDVDNLVDPLLIAFGGAAKLAPVLLSARMSPAIRLKAEQLQEAMLARWLNRGIQSNLSSMGYTYENMDALNQYYSALDSSGRLKLFTHLQSRVGDGELILMVLKCQKLFAFAKDVEAALVVRWKNETPDILPAGLITEDMDGHEMDAVYEYYKSVMANNPLH